MFRFIGKMYAWDVVNEAIDEVSGELRDSIWSRAFNYSFIETAFRTAHAADPNAKLYINEYNLEAVDTKSDALYALVKELLGKGVPVHGVGLQGHFRENEIPSTFQDNLKRFADLGLDVAITELNVRYKLPGSADKIAKQAQDYSRAFSACMNVDRCVGVTVWGFTDKYSWLAEKGYGEQDL